MFRNLPDDHTTADRQTGDSAMWHKTRYVFTFVLVCILLQHAAYAQAIPIWHTLSSLSSALEQGKVAAHTALRILSGVLSTNPPAETPTHHVIKWKELEDGGLKTKDSSAGTMEFNRQATIWNLNRWHVICGIFLILLEALLIGSLLWQRANRKAEAVPAVGVEAAQESESRFRLLANAAPVMLWMSGTEKLRTYLNQPWLAFTGRTLDQELGMGWLKGVYFEDLKTCLDTYNQSFDRREPFTMQYRLRRQQGDYRWVLETGVPRFNLDGSFAGYIGCCIDITERKRAEEALATIGRRLIEAHEEERTHIARELHDDINQRLALLAVELDRWSRDSLSPLEFHTQLRRAQERITDIGRDVQSLSHRLHSSKLEYLGLATAARSFCRELSEQNNVQISFSPKGSFAGLPHDVSLCLFRVLQEALQNAVKHSGVRSFEVDLHRTSNDIELIVSDRGVGFEPHNGFTDRGLGLISMRERVQLVAGEFYIKSIPGGGTTIRARIPIKMEDQHTKAG